MMEDGTQEIDLSTSNNGNMSQVPVKFSHIEMFVDHIDDVCNYKEYEDSINEFHRRFDNDAKNINDTHSHSSSSMNVACARDVWKSIPRKQTNKREDKSNSPNEAAFVPHGRDVVRQLIAGFGFRLTGSYPAFDTTASVVTPGVKSVVVTSNDPSGIQVVVSSLNGGVHSSEGYYQHFDPANIQKFYKVHSDRQGIAVLAFEVGKDSLEGIYERYRDLHPKLLPEEYQKGVKIYDNAAKGASEWNKSNGGKVLEVFAYYQGEKNVSVPDEGTRLRFIEPLEKCASSGEVECAKCLLPGISPVPATFHSSCHSAYFDHWVSNVISRTGFLETLEDTLYFTPKVDFNAGVVAAGEAQIESTVTGNNATLPTTDKGEKDEKDAALRDQSQIYLPINNALTAVGHVHGFLEEIGQGVQHVASRVDDIIGFVQEANDRRKVFDEGFTFLNIPRSYYGVLTKSMLAKGLHPNSSESPSQPFLSEPCATVIFDICKSEGILKDDCSVDLDVSKDGLVSILDGKVPSSHMEEYCSKKDGIVQTILHSRYVNLYNLLRDHLSEESYVAIVRNQILVDVQGEDLLFQIFTSNILQRKSGEEAPFFEFIQRVCSECTTADSPNGETCPKKIKPGCGGFGIRNFLTLFLSIEVTKAMLEASNAKKDGDLVGHQFAQSKVDIFTEQLNESNPILTEISDAMTLEGVARDAISGLYANDGKGGKGGESVKSEVEVWRRRMEEETRKKVLANEALMECNKKYQERMKALRESREIGK